jgi:hypothetical protein
MESLYISSPEEYLHKMQGDRKVKVIQESIYLGEFSVTLFDVALYKQGPREDQFYIRNPYYQVNVRRGNSLCLFNELNFCRRGMQKFYDFELRYLERPLNSMTGYHEKVASRVLSLTPPLQMHRLFKENGENC